MKVLFSNFTFARNFFQPKDRRKDKRNEGKNKKNVKKKNVKKKLILLK